MASFYDGNKWLVTKVDDVIQILIDNGKDYLETEYDKSKKKYDVATEDKHKILTEKAITQFDRYLLKKNHKDLKKRYDSEVKLMMYNNKEIVMKNKKQIDTK